MRVLTTSPILARSEENVLQLAGLIIFIMTTASAAIPDEAAVVARHRIAELLEDATTTTKQADQLLDSPDLPATRRRALQIERAKVIANSAALQSLMRICLEDAGSCEAGFHALLPTLQRFDRRQLRSLK